MSNAKLGWLQEDSQCMNKAKIAAKVPTMIAWSWTRAKLAHATAQYLEFPFSLVFASSKFANVDKREASVISKFPFKKIFAIV